MKREDISFAPGIARIAADAVAPLHQLLEASRTSAGEPYGDYGHDQHEDQAWRTRPLLVN